MVGLKVKIGGKENTQGRGLQQVAADIITIVLHDGTSLIDITERFNRRIWRGLERAYKYKPQELVMIDKSYRNLSKPVNPKLIASVPPGSLPVIWSFIKNGCK